MSKQQEQLIETSVEADAKAANKPKPEYDPACDFTSDAPITSHTEDKFNRTDFAHSVAETLMKRPAQDSLVIGIYGKWGSGKSSVLNMMQKKIEEDSDVIIIKFNPWYFSSEEDLIRGFFAELCNKLGDILPKIKKYFLNFLLCLSPLSGKLSIPFIDGPEVQVNFKEMEKAFEELTRTSLDDEKNKIEKVLLAAEKRIIVFVDDIDRLDKDETHTLFKIVKLFANFPYMAYVLAFDDEVVAQALGNRYGKGDEAGRRFIEKIVQIPLHLPPVKNLNTFLLSELDKIFEIFNLNITADSKRILTGYVNIDMTPRFFKTLRECVKFTNSLRFLFPLVQNTVYPPDFIAIEIIRTSYPEVYIVLHKKSLRLKARAKNNSGIIHYDTLEIPSDHVDEQYNLILKRLFQTKGSTKNINSVKKYKRMCHVDYFDSYFLYTIDQETQKLTIPQPQPDTQE